MEDRNYTVYMHVNKSNGKKYVGITNNTQRRWRSGGIEYKPHQAEKQNRPFWNAIQKYGFDNFSHVILRKDLTFEEACAEEIAQILKHSSSDKTCGYNVALGGNGGLVYKVHPKGMLGKPQTEHQRSHQKEWASISKNNCMKNGDVIWGVTHEHPRGMLGKNQSDEFKNKQSKRLLESSPSRKRCWAVMPCGDKIEFKSVKLLCEYFQLKGGASNSLYLSMKKKPYEITRQNYSKDKRYDLVGMRIEVE